MMLLPFILRRRKSVLLVLAVFSGISSAQTGSQCGPSFLDQCIKIGTDFLGDPQNIFPSSEESIQHVCRTVFPKAWSDFISCTKTFAASCVSPVQLSSFNRAVGDSINSVHKMCTNEDFKKNYLDNAACIKNTMMDEKHCKSYYDTLMNEITHPSSSSSLCCAHDSFKSCLLEHSESCDRDAKAKSFAKIMLENGIGFLLNQCSDESLNKVCRRYSPRSDTEDKSSSSSISDGHYFPNGEGDGGNNLGGRGGSTDSNNRETTRSGSNQPRRQDSQPRDNPPPQDLDVLAAASNSSVAFDDFLLNAKQQSSSFLKTRANSGPDPVLPRVATTWVCLLVTFLLVN